VDTRTIAKAGVTVFVLLFVAVLLGAGPKLPGPHVREWLGLAERGRKFVPCYRPPREPGAIRAPNRPLPGPGAWRQEPTAPVAREELQAAEVDGDIYLANGLAPNVTSLRLVEVFDPGRGSYRRAPPSPQPLDHSMLVSHRGALYLVGGWINGNPTNRFWTYSPATRRWRELARMRVRRGGPAGAVVGNRLYVTGGLTVDSLKEYETEPVRSVEAYDFATGRWSDAPPMPTAGHHHAATTLDGRLYVAGGRVKRDFSLDRLERFDPAKGRWERLPPIPFGTGDPEVVSAAGRLVVIGGGDDIVRYVTPATWAFDPPSARWSRLPDLPIARHGHAAAVHGGRIYVFGGAPCSGFGLSADARSLPMSAVTASR
jgi:N-acetylneuraminic acid mutarotase